MKKLSLFFFYTYIGLVVLAGFWGAFINPAWDIDFLFDLKINELADFQRINILSQYRFLRAIELGFGIFSLVCMKEIFTVKKFNLLFMTIMGLGILARLASWGADGNPGLLTKFFLFYEAIGWIILFFFFKSNLYKND